MNKLILIFKIISRKIAVRLVVFISNFSPKFSIVNYLFNFFKKTSHELIFFTKYSNKEKIIKYLKKNQEINEKNLDEKYSNHPVNENMACVINDLNHYGISENLKIDIEDYEIEDFIKDMNSSYYYDSHVPSKNSKKDAHIKPVGAYKSYDYQTQLNNQTLLKLCSNPNIVKIAQKYLGVNPKIYSINTFNTLPGQKAFTHDFHRDVDNLKWLVVFIYWTKTLQDDGAYEQINFTHKPSIEIKNLLQRDPSIYSDNFDKFYKKTITYGQNENNLKKIFKGEIRSIYGDPGKIVACDTSALHRGTPVKNERLVTWIRYGVMESRQKVLNLSETLDEKIILSENNMKFLKNLKFKEVLSNIVMLN